MIRIKVLDPGQQQNFPPVTSALTEPDGLLCAGGDLGIERLLRAYRNGIFPWFNPGEPILWWSPDPRCVFDLATLRPARSLRRFARDCPWTITADQAFAEVVDACAAPRAVDVGTWIGADMRAAYVALHASGNAHSVEIWENGQLVGGIYGVALGRIFFGESMFSRRSNASKIALFALAAQLRIWNFTLIDGQVSNPHLLSLGATVVPRAQFIERLDRDCDAETAPAPWSSRWKIGLAGALD